MRGVKISFSDQSESSIVLRGVRFVASPRRAKSYTALCVIIAGSSVIFHTLYVLQSQSIIMVKHYLHKAHNYWFKGRKKTFL